MSKTKVLISGASVAGPALAHFLHRGGCEVTVVERAPEPRDSGYAVDFRGEALDVLADLGILEEVRAHETAMRDTLLLDETGAEVGRLPATAFAGELEVPKRELTRILHARTANDIDYRFGDAVTVLAQDDSGVSVEFDSGRSDRFDLVFGADGLYSGIRRLAFGPHADAVHHLGLSGAGFTTDNFLGLDHRGILQRANGTAVYLFSAADPARLTVSLTFATPSADLDRRDRADQEEALRSAFAEHGWEAPRLLRAMADADDFYFASTCQVHLPTWSRGRVALLGDAAYCAAPTSGAGTSQALIGARTLSRELLTPNTTHTTAFTTYESTLRPYITENQITGRTATLAFGGTTT
ncbi:FAD-dependent monooxygenase [Nocardia terpenica]|uniref:FAD-dependent monooxygenase n=1 Tax=Nocardia terpenica TaxID=455432 RepID=UPI0018958C46|nr:FAD-dependent monooxygenase [Nocardia terpenica]MBF6065935.1 FAD-dependent monooxygenase [Nocardia terpenica]MBF6108869.1 FAD-dependent monooxygenase [Nocardia terpenica]MBF6116179.1 FAD-dependent monooxygenase [Nocardia terpenica]MBF6123180.1 FAD-dependent monooxygenase [Nocardia terpenica]MBF6153138.1 FAD-dependent monooxygenase [Nocardia terpenica]